MDLLASQVAQGAKGKSAKKVQKNDIKQKKEKVIAKVDSASLSKPLKKKKNLIKSVTEITGAKKELIKKSLKLKEKNDKKLVKLTKEVPSNILKAKNKKVPENVAPNKNKISKKIEKQAESISVLDNHKKEKPKTIQSNKTSIENVKLSKKLKKQAVKSSNSKENEVVDKKMKKQISDKTNDQSGISKLKKIKTESEKLIKVEDNTEIKNIKSKKRKLQDIVKSEESESQFPTRKEVVKYVKALLKLVEIHDKQKNLFNSDKPPINMQVTCIRIPKTPLHQMRILLPHTLVNATDDVALFVKDLKKGRRRDPEDTINHYKDILEQHGCTQIKAVIPLNQLKTEYRPFEMRRRLLSTYDYFLTDGAISGHIAHLVGKTFREKRKLPTSIHMSKPDLKAQIDIALRKTPLQIHSDGNTSNVTIATCSMSEEKIVDNIMSVIQDLNKNFPGGWENIQSLRIKTPRSQAIPIYVSLKNKNDVETPVLAPKRPKAYKEVEGELSTFTKNMKVSVLPDGTVRLHKVGDESDEELEDNSDEKEVKTEIQSSDTETLAKKGSKANEAKIKKENKDQNKVQKAVEKDEDENQSFDIQALNKKKLKIDKEEIKKGSAKSEFLNKKKREIEEAKMKQQNEVENAVEDVEDEDQSFDIQALNKKKLKIDKNKIKKGSSSTETVDKKKSEADQAKLKKKGMDKNKVKNVVKVENKNQSSDVEALDKNKFKTDKAKIKKGKKSK